LDDGIDDVMGDSDSAYERPPMHGTFVFAHRMRHEHALHGSLHYYLELPAWAGCYGRNCRQVKERAAWVPSADGQRGRGQDRVAILYTE
jgi:hypothetical protein